MYSEQCTVVNVINIFRHCSIIGIFILFIAVAIQYKKLNHLVLSSYSIKQLH